MNKSEKNTKKFLFVLWDGGGTIPPVLVLAKRVVTVGHMVRVLGPRSIEEKIKALGADFSPYVSAPDRDPRNPDQDGKVKSPASVAIAACNEYADDVKEIIDSSPVDIVVTDYILTGSYIAAEAAAIPFASIVPTVYPLPAPGLPPFGTGFSPAKGLPGRIRDSVVNFVLQHLWNMNLKRINETRTKFGLSPVKSIKDQILRAGRMLVLSSSVFDFPASVPSHAIYCGPQLEDTSELPLWQPFWPENDKTPLILISLSTTYQAQDDVIRRLLSAVEPLHVHVVVTLGYSLNPDEFQAPSNVKLVPFIPHQQILPYTALAITHGGHGTVLGALSYGVPLICMPMGRDQRDIAARVVWLGTGLRISHKATPRAFRSAITQVLNESSYRDKAKTIASEMARKNESVRALMELEALIRWHNSKRRMKEKNITQRKRNPAVTLLEIIVVLGAPVLCHFLLPLSRVVPGLWRLLGIIPMILGLLLANSGARAFGKAKTGFQLQTGGSSLVISGPFRYTRNPMYLGMVLWLTGLAVLLGSLIVFLFPLLFFVLANFLLIPPEERILQQTFGERFISYRQQVRRWL